MRLIKKSSKAMHVKIRDIEIEDIQIIFEQLKDLASITGLSDILVTTPESLEKELFNPKADWYGLIAEVIPAPILNQTGEFKGEPAQRRKLREHRQDLKNSFGSFEIGAGIKGQIAGSCLYSITNINRAFHSSPAIYIDILYVSEKFRKLGIAKALITKVADIAKQKKLERIELWCSKSNDIAQAAYASIGATKVDMIDVMRFDVEKLL
jgi:ribosomal protein S18 acetylase RimI-like enzyme